VKSAYSDQLEQEIDLMEEELEPLKQFILPGGTVPASYVHLARTVCRRAERSVVELVDTPDEAVNSEVLAYLNRLSDWLFVLGRVINARACRSDVYWKKPEDA
jgi:cob(I)alamin adenosyltransferase